ncbi:AbrB family transcriptional regulator [Salipaludibacillus agaradhaerens]|uniref:AbrB family transcriptional regulator n=1 Tax=Salipaludibacillus agaradhaerens TaxID=76935 RepID=A0A9Q4FYP5_SALAG|nr:AbrB family transcriptional regulator [Salipaludibacillus agaradhaerens]MCR6096347.1 AbrB family transcriptional regulator [Salipaludibacillus agaradhaerens]MCR6114094.1 AbrB family transcriptional regulator [Salipaludibacillus agaradhaerens]
MSYQIKPFIEAIGISVIGGGLFHVVSLPLAWMLGPLTSVMLWEGLTTRTLVWPDFLKKLGLIILGISFGFYFTFESLKIVGPFIIPYLLITVILILISIFNSAFITKWINIDKKTSVFGSIPGGLAEMVVASEDVKANSALVMVFQTIRLLVVLFTVPFIITQFFPHDSNAISAVMTIPDTNILSLHGLWLILPILLGIKYQHSLPAGIMIIPLAVTATISISSINIPSIPPLIFLIAQLFVGASLGKSISLTDIKLAKKYAIIYIGLACWLIVLSFGFGILLESMTTMDLQTAILSTAPGGLVEMVLTASIVGADPAIVTSLQLMRVMVIVLVAPSALKWYFSRKINDRNKIA